MYHYKACGLSNVYLKNGFTVIDDDELGECVKFDDIHGLQQAIAMSLIEKESELSGEEVRYLRNEMDMSQKALADVLDVEDQTVANWEKGATKIKRTSDIVIRMLYVECQKKEGSVRTIIDRLNDMDNTAHDVKLYHDCHGWQRDMQA